jgi:hypothetical protein
MKTLCFVLGVAVSLVCSVNIAQNRSAPTDPASEAVPHNCEGNVFVLNAAHVAANATGADTLIMAIARLGDGERRRELNRRRLHNVRVFLTELQKHDASKVIIAEGERVRGYGRVELYVGGRLFQVIAIKTNDDLLVSATCEPDNIRPKWPDTNFYPYLLKKPKRR